ncbi:hypothetical protein CKAH01_12435 [Colletotrichum kahawae]|uniref:Uncharacterized protein n=1 Tax=Colletotrichum kahawae TaxID=34407 RepID=A0AAD9YQU8_COLKA|nr:hypothetical protein CKAH01_12435 [Colletotrichum kahawae]
MRPVSLFVLPRELRDVIHGCYVSIDGGYVCDTDGFIRGKLKGANGDRIHLSLVYTCKRVAEEMRPSTFWSPSPTRTAPTSGESSSTKRMKLFRTRSATPEASYQTRCELKDRPTPAFLNSDQITGNVASWVVEAMALLPAGMPAKSFSLLLDGDPAPTLCSEIFQCIVQRDVAWQLAWDMSLKKKLLPEVSWFEKRGESVIRHGHYTNTDVHQHQRFPSLRTGFWGYFFEDFPQGFSNIGKESFPVHCNFDTGIARDVEDIVMQHGRWNLRKWEQEWFRHQTLWWETAPPLPEWMAVLEENVMENMKYMPYLKHMNEILA